MEATSETHVKVFIHIAIIGPWRLVMQEQHSLLVAAGLGGADLRCGVVGPASPKDLSDIAKLYRIVYRSFHVGEYEFPTLCRLADACRDWDGDVLYLHSKGVTQRTPNQHLWRKFMQHFVIERQVECRQVLREFDAAGVQWKDEANPHYHGNFWWATSRHIRSLPDMHTIPKQVPFEAEAWIGMNRQARLAEVFSLGNVSLYRFPANAELYRSRPMAVRQCSMTLASNEPLNPLRYRPARR